MHCASPRSWPVLAQRVVRNPAFFVDLLEYADGNQTKRHAALKRLVGQLRRRALEGDAKEWHSQTKGFARDLLDENPWLPEQLGGTPHLGAVRLAGSSRVSRLDYSLLINHELLRFKKEFAGYGFGTTSLVLPSGRSLSGLELAQSWSLLGNAGHLFGTFATERALLYELFREEHLFEQFTEGVSDTLREPASRLVKARRLTDFYYALAAWRLSRVAMDEDTRRDVLAIWSHFLSERAQSKQSVDMWAFRSARRLAYNQLHVYLGIGPPVDTAGSEGNVRALSPWAELNYEPSMVQESSLLQPLLKSADAYQWENYFSGTDVAANVLAHVRGFRAWWKQASDDLPSAIDSLFGGRPPTWQDLDPPRLTHFTRVKIPRAGSEWLEEIRDWLSHADAWGAGNFLVAPRSVGAGGVPTSGLLVDVYCREGQPVPCSLLWATATRLAGHCERSWEGRPTAECRELWRSIAVFGLRSFALLTAPSVRPVLQAAAINPSETDGNGQVGYAVVATAALGLAHTRGLAARLEDEVRQRELRAAIAIAEETATLHQDAPLLMLLGTTSLVDRKKAQKNRAEFDGVWAFFEPDCVHWYLMEHKKRRSPNGDLASKLKHLTVTSREYVPTEAKVRGQAAVATVKFGGS